MTWTPSTTAKNNRQGNLLAQGGALAVVPPVEPFVKAGLTIDIASGVIFLLLGLLVAIVRPRRPLNLWFALFASGFGLFWIFVNFPNLGWANKTTAVVTSLGALMWVVGVIFVGLRYPQPLRGTARRAIRLPALVAASHTLFHAALAIVFLRTNPGAGIDLPGYRVEINPATNSLWAPAFSGIWFLLFMMATRFGRQVNPRDGQAIRMVTWAFLAFNSISIGVSLAQAIQMPPELQEYSNSFRLAAGFDVVLTLLLMAVWARTARIAPSGLRRGAAGIAAATALLMLLGVAFAFATNVDHATNLGLQGLARLFGVAVLAYAILRLQLFDIEIKLRWGINRSALVLVFLAVFFVVDQLIEAIAGEALGTIAGAVASGLLLFALHPLQKMTERIGAAALPHARADDNKYILRRKRETYRNAYATAWADGNLTAKDQRMLQQVRDALGLPDKDIVAIERDWAKHAPKA